MTWTAGTMVNEEIRLVQPFGAADSRVWIAEQLDWKRRVVVKLLPPLDGDDPEAVFDVLERISGAQVESPHVVQLFNQGLGDDGTPYVLMELLAGQSLAERLGAGRIPIGETRELLRQLVAVLEAIHAAGQLHTAVEPANVMLCGSGDVTTVKLLNLGIASTKPRPKTWPYISPEQYLGRPLSPSTDLWALGVVVYEMLSAKHPTTAEARRKLKWEPSPLSELWLSDVPEELDDWFLRALEPRPEKRFPSAAEMLAVFESTLAAGAAKAEDAGTSTEPLAAVGEHRVIAVGTPTPEPSGPAEDDAVIVIEVDD